MRLETWVNLKILRNIRNRESNNKYNVKIVSSYGLIYNKGRQQKTENMGKHLENTH